MLALLTHGFFILVGTAVFAATPWGTATLNNVGPHGFSEILYEFSSASANNGSGFEGLGDNTVPWNVSTGIVMLLARFIPIILPLAIVGSLMAKRRDGGIGGHARRGGWHFRRHAARDDCCRRRPDILPGCHAGAGRRASDLREIENAPEDRHMEPWFASIRLVVATMLICVAGYAAVIWGIGQILTPYTAEGSLITAADGTVIGSRLIAQKFTEAALLLARPSAVDYNASAARRQQQIADESRPDRSALRRSSPQYGATADNPLPPELAAASGGGLGPAYQRACGSLPGEARGRGARPSACRRSKL